MLNNECMPNNKVFRISLYHFVIRGKKNMSMQVWTSGRRSTWRHKELSTSWKAPYMANTCTSIFDLGERLSFRANVGNAQHISYVASVMKDSEVVGHITRVICSAMIAVFVYNTLEVSKCTLPIYVAGHVALL